VNAAQILFSLQTLICILQISSQSLEIQNICLGSHLPMHHLKHKNCNAITVFWDEIPFTLAGRYSMVLSIKSPLFCMKTFSTSLKTLQSS